MRALVTGAAGFIGSRVSAALLAEGTEVRGLDCFSAYYDRSLKEAHLLDVRDHDGFQLVEDDLGSTDLESLLDGVDVVFHLAAQPGVRASWSTGFEGYVANNVLATQRLLEAMLQHTPSARLVYSSSSSVYGDATDRILGPESMLRPRSPYGVTKLAGEQLCSVYAANWDLPTVSLRYFTVYGGGQRPDMALNRLIEAGLGGPTFPMFGDGSQQRDFTHVSDVVAANMAAMRADVEPGFTCNVAGGTMASLNELIAIAEGCLGTEIPIDRQDVQPGDVRRTHADVTLTESRLGWQPTVALADGVAEQVAWQRARRQT